MVRSILRTASARDLRKLSVALDGSTRSICWYCASRSLGRGGESGSTDTSAVLPAEPSPADVYSRDCRSEVLFSVCDVSAPSCPFHSSKIDQIAQMKTKINPRASHTAFLCSKMDLNVFVADLS